MKSLLPLASQILLAAILTVVVVLGISSLFEVNFLKHSEVQQLQKRGTVTADRLANSLAYPLWNLNQKETERVVLDELSADEVTKIIVLDEKGQVYIGKFKTADRTIKDLSAAENVTVPATRNGDSQLLREIKFRDKLIGKAVLDLSPAYIEAELTKWRWGVLIKMLVLVALLSLVLYLSLRVLVVSRLSLLKSWIEGVGAGVAPPYFKSSEEFNSLSGAFDKMRVNLRDKHEELEREVSQLRELNSSLQDKIEEREKAEAALRESESRFRQITENISEVLWLNNPTNEICLYISPSYESVWGKTTQSLYEDPFSYLDAIHPEDREWVAERTTAERKQGFSLEYRIVKPDGSIRWIWDRGFPIKDENGQVERIAGIAEDITDRKNAEEKLRKYADEVHDLYNSAPCGYHSLDENGVYARINDTELQWLGFTREEVIGKLRFSEVLIPKQRAFFEKKYRDFIVEGSIRDVEYQLLSKNGESRSVLLSALASRNAEGKFVMSRATLYDITDRRHAEQLVKRSEEKFSLAFRSSPVGLIVSRVSDGKFIEINQAAMTILGYSSDELIGHSARELGLWVNLEDREAVLEEFTQLGTVPTRELNFRTSQGAIVTCLYSAEPIEVDGESCVLSVLLDITERRYMEQALKANEELLRLFVKHTPAAIAMFDTDMRYLQVSDRFLTDYHLEGQNIIGKLHYDVFPNIPERWKAAHRRILAGAVERNDEDPYEEADGSPGWLAWESLPWRRADGEIGGLILFTQVITERKRAERALRASEERFAKIFDQSPYRMGIVRASDGVILDVNECWIRQTGFSREEVVNKVVCDLDQWLDDDARTRFHQILERRENVYGFEGAIKTKSGERRYAWGSIVLVEFAGELCYLWAAHDITDQKIVEEEKRQLIHDLGERVKELTALHQTARILQDEAKTLPDLLQEIVSLLPPAWQYPDVTAARIRFGELEFKTRGFASSPWSQSMEFVGGHLKGEIEVVYLEEKPEEDIGPFLLEEANLINSLAEMISSALDRRYALRALQESEEVFRTLTENVAAGIYIYRHSRFVYVNPTAEQLTGYSRDELMGLTLFDLIHPSFREAVTKRVKHRELGWQAPSRDEEKIVTKSGEERWWDVSAAGTKFRGEPAVIVTTFDITERKAAEKALRVSEEQLRRLSARVQSAREEEGTRIAREIHDELGAALTGLKWDLESIDTRLRALNGDPTISDVRKQINSMTGLIETTINTVRRISSDLRPGVLDDLGLVAAIEWQAQQFQKRTGLKVHWDTDLETADVSREGATVVFRIFQEVLTNVLRHSRARNIYVKLNQFAKLLELEVTDDGRGITEEEQKNTRSIGLLGMKERALLVGGEVSIMGQKGKGTTVTVSIPLSKERETHALA